MNARVKHESKDIAHEGMSSAFMMSLLFHMSIITVAVFGLPYISKPPPEISPPIPVELMEISDKTQTTKPAERATVKPDEKKEPPKPEPPRPKQAPKQTSSTPPRPVESSPREELTVPDKAKPKPEEKPKTKPPAPKKALTTPDKKSPPQEDPFQSLLKNLQDEKPQTDEKGDAKTANTPKGQPVPLGERMTMSEMDALRQQLSQCWNVLAGARYAEDLVVDMKLYVNPDRTVREASVIDVVRYNTDDVFRAAADSAMRAVRDPECSPLRLPPDKYDQWKEITVRFDPRDIL